MKSLKEISNDIINREADFIGQAREEYDDHPFFRQMSGVCVEVQWLEEVAEKLFRNPNKEEIREALESLECYQDRYEKRDISDIISEIEDYLKD